MEKVTIPQTTLKNAKVVRKFDKWTLESFTHPNDKTQYVLTDGWVCNYVIFYGFNGKWAADNEIYRKDIVAYLNKKALSFN